MSAIQYKKLIVFDNVLNYKICFKGSSKNFRFLELPAADIIVLLMQIPLLPIRGVYTE